jgi:DNA-binding CsgD family transcriptional regulator
MTGLLPQDYSRMLDLAVAVIDNLETSESAWQLVCTELMATLDAGFAGCFEARWPDGATRAVAAWPTWTEQMPWTPQDVAAHPLVRHHAVRNDPAPRTIDEVADECQWLRSGDYAAARDHFGDAAQHLILPLPRSSGVIRYVGAARSGRVFSDRDRAYLRRIHPLVTSVDSQRTQLRRLVRSLPVETGSGTLAQRTAGCGITPRELTVLSLLGEGLTAVAMARRLGISPHTVTKHQENLYRKLETTDRLTTVLIAQQRGILPGPTGRPDQPVPARRRRGR